MYVLGIETSCDETSVAVVRDGKRVLSNIVASSLKFHSRYGGIVPEIASRMQLETIVAVAQEARKTARVRLKDIGLISVVSGPGLLGSLLVGVSFAKALSLSLDIPLLGVNHIYSHLYANFLEGDAPQFPFIGLVVSGGHTSLFFVESFARIKLLGSTQDDACGEAFDKVAKILGLGYPGGPAIEREAKKGNPKKIRFQCSGTENPLDFSFSGIKTAVLYRLKGRAPIGRDERQDIAASFQEAVIDTLIKKALSACRLKRSGFLVVGGGVAANKRLRGRLAEEASRNRIRVYLPPQALCMDNAAMVAGLGYRLFRRGAGRDLGLTTQLN